MKIIHHPKVLEEKARQIEIEKLNVEISQHILAERHRRVNKIVSRIYYLVFLSMGLGLIFGIIMSALFIT